MDNIEYVVENSENVIIQTENIKSIINSIESSQYEHWSQKDEYFTKFTEQELIIFSFILESMNFCFWPNYNWKIIKNNKEYFGSDTLLYTILNAIQKRIIKLDIDSLNKLSKETFLLFMKNNNQYPPMIEERFQSLKETINTIYNNKNFFNDLYSISSDIELENFIANNFINFKDVSNYKGKKIIFNKRCRLLVADLYYVSKTINNNINNINNLKGCADYSLPRFFREMKVFQYSEKLKKKIDSGSIIRHNSSLEVEIRASTLYVIEIIKQELKKRNLDINSIQLDNILWRISRGKKQTLPHHTMSIYY